MDHTPLRLRSSRRRELRISDVVPRTSLSLSPCVLLYIFYRSLSSRMLVPKLFSHFLHSSLFWIFASLSLPFLSLSPLRISISLIFRPFPSFVASVVPYISRFLSGTLCAALCTFFFLSCSPISFSFCPRHAFRPRAGRTDRACSRLSWPPHGLQDKVRGRSLLLCSGRCGDPREEERERNSHAETRTRRERPLWLLFAGRITSAARRRRGRMFRRCWPTAFFYCLLLYLISLPLSFSTWFPACVHADVYPGSVMKCCFVASVPMQVTHTDVFATKILCKAIR